MIFSIKHLIAVLLACTLLLTLGCASTDAQLDAAEPNQARSFPDDADGVFIHIYSGTKQKHIALMALTMAKNFADTHPVLVYCDVDAIDLVLKDSPNLSMQPYGSSHDIIKELLDKNVPIYACPGCLRSFGKSNEELMPGIQPANKDAFFTFTKGRILTLDY